MDIFIHNIPTQANDNHLEEFFRKQLEPFKINVFNLQRLKARSCAVLTILEKQKVKRFLNNCRSTSQKGTVQLKYMDTLLQCALSKFEPEKVVLQALRKDVNDQRVQPSEPVNRTDSWDETILSEQSYAYEDLQCGNWDYQASGLVFVSRFSADRKGSAVFGRKNLALVSDPVDKPGVTTTYRIDVPYSSIHSLTIGSLQGPSLTITMYEAPRVYKQANFDMKILGPALGNSKASAARPRRERVTNLGGQHQSVVGSCFVYRLRIADTGKIAAMGLMLRKGWEMPPSISWPTEVVKPTVSHEKEMDLLIMELTSRYSALPFSVQFQIQRLAQNGFLAPHRVLDLIPVIVKLHETTGEPITSQVLQKLTRKLPAAAPEVNGDIFTVSRLEELMKEVKETCIRTRDHAPNVAKLKRHMSLVHRAVVTPAGIYLEGPEPEVTNRVLRAYIRHIDHFVRVTFADEDGDRLFFGRFVSLDSIYHTRFKAVLDSGVFIAGRRFEYLGSSHSSLREHTCWFMAPFDHDGVKLNAAAVITRLGDFSNIRCPAKCAARIGQAFSTTDGAISIPPTAVFEIPDIERGGRVFSDGVGTMSRDTLAMLWKEYKPGDHIKPTLYQIRYQGAKGMIALDTRLKGKILSLRKSMIKFTGTNISEIEICGSAARPLPMHLNRQYIKILEDLGVGVDVFLNLQDKSIEKLRRTTTSALDAASFLDRERVGKTAKLPWLMRKLHSMNFNFWEDPFLRSAVEMAVLVQLRDMKYRARIFVEEAVTLYGIMDETNTLAEGEIFCRSNRAVITGRVVVTRAPALHPGDIQVVTAVDVARDSPLRALHNCVVFSQRGRRDLPSQLSGGDLDGDIFSVIYDTNLIPSRTVKAADYPRVPAKDIGRPVTRKDMTDFFIDFMENDQLGRIANIHTQLADRRIGGTQHPDCILLAEMHSTAVDFAKTGIRVDLELFPRTDLYRPDFMAPSPRVFIENGVLSLDAAQSIWDQDEHISGLDPDVKRHRYYESDLALGKLYRAIDEKEFLTELQERGRETVTNASDSVSMIQRLWDHVKRQTRITQWEHYRGWARTIKETYDSQILSSIDQYSDNSRHLISELEIIVGTLLGERSAGGRSKRFREMSVELKDAYERTVHYTYDCIARGPQQEDGKDEILERTIACFAVAMDEKFETWDRAKRKLESFRYVAAAACLNEMENLHE